jgi:hypothetical protein
MLRLSWHRHMLPSRYLDVAGYIIYDINLWLNVTFPKVYPHKSMPMEASA